MRFGLKNSAKNILRNAATGVLVAILVSACGGGGGSAGTNPNQPPPSEPPISAASVLVSTDSGVIQSAGADGSEVTVKALVKDANNNVVPGVQVIFKTDSGVITAISSVSDEKGVATAKLSIGGDPTTRPITVTVTATGAAPKTTIVNVVGTTITISGYPSVNINMKSDISVTLKDSAGVPLKNIPVTFETKTNQLTVKGGGAAVTNASGQLVLSFAANSGSSDTVSVAALGETAALEIKINTTDFAVKVVNGLGALLTQANINTCQIVSVHYADNGVPQSGAVSLNSALGGVFSDGACAIPLTTSIALDGSGNAIAYLKAGTPGVATLNVTHSATNITTQGTIEFVAPLVSSANITLQPDYSVIGTNASGSTTQQSTIRAVVRDGTTQNNLVKNASVNFSIVSDPSGGHLNQPSVLTTGSDGSASVVYVAGTSPAGLNGVKIQAQIIQGASTASVIAMLTVSKQSLFITAGTGNTVATPTSATYQVDYAVFVTDASGNAVSGANVQASVRPRTYSKGRFTVQDNGFGTTLGTLVWAKEFPIYTCLNEDVNSDGILDPSEDVNNSGMLEPGIPVTVTSIGKTDATGTTTFSLLYPRDHAMWTNVDMVITGSVAGTEAHYLASFVLPGLGSDYSDTKISPPGQVSPYGEGACTSKL